MRTSRSASATPAPGRDKPWHFSRQRQEQLRAIAKLTNANESAVTATEQFIGQGGVQLDVAGSRTGDIVQGSWGAQLAAQPAHN
jgi:hypothetical protein